MLGPLMHSDEASGLLAVLVCVTSCAHALPDLVGGRHVSILSVDGVRSDYFSLSPRTSAQRSWTKLSSCIVHTPTRHDLYLILFLQN